MNGRTYIAGSGRTSFAVHSEATVTDLVLEAVEAALADARVTRDRIDYVVTASNDLCDGKTASNLLITEVVGAVMKGETRVASDGLFALLHADLAIRSGRYRTVLVTAHCKESEADGRALSRWAFDPIYLQPLGVDFPAMALLQANMRGESGDMLATATVPASSTRTYLPATPETRLDGATAVILTSDESLPGRTPVSIFSAGQLTDVHYPGRRNLVNGILSKTISVALGGAGLANLDSFAFAALSADTRGEFSYYRQILDDLGFRGTCLDQTPAPFIVQGMSRLIDSIASLAAMESAENARALVHGHAGPAAQSECVLLLEAAHAA